MLRSIIFNSPFEYDVTLFKRSFGLTRSLFILYVHEHDRLGFGLYLIRLHLLILIVLIATAGKGQSFPVEYYLEWVEEFSEGITQARGNTRISCTEFDYDERARDCKCILRSEPLA